MWAQLITAQLKPGTDLTDAANLLRANEQPGSGLVREIFMHDQNDPTRGYILALFESEEHARAREQDPRRADGQRALNELLGSILAGPPEFVDLTVTAEF